MTIEDIQKAVAAAIESAPEVVANKVADLTRGAIAGAASADGPIPERAPPSASQVPPPAPGTDAAFELWLARHARNDIGNARRLIARHGCDLVSVRAMGWLAWDGVRWNSEKGERAAMRAAQETADAMYGEAAALELAGPYRGEENTEFEKRIGDAKKWASGSSNARRISAMLEMAQPLLEKQTSDLDAAPFLFNAANGTLELGALQSDGAVDVVFREHRRSDLLTRASPVDYDPEATECPLWRQSLDFFIPDREIQKFLQRLYGYGLTSSIEEQCIILQHGEGRNFKSTMVEMMSRVLGDYAVPIPIGALLAKPYERSSEPTPDIARLPGARLVTAEEPRQGAPLDESFIKRMTSGMKLSARHLNRGFFDFMPQFKVIVSFNRKPTIVGTDDGIWRRIRMVPFDVQIAEEEADKGFIEKLKHEAPAILNWAIDGYRMWREHGLGAPDAVKRATERYRGESDKIGPFLASACVITGNDTEMVTAADIWHAYLVWCRRNGFKAESQNWLGRRLIERKGVRREMIRTVKYVGIELVDLSLLAEPKPDRSAQDKEPEAT